MSAPTDREKAFVSFLCSLADAEDRAALAALRRGLGRPPGEAAGMHCYVVPWLPPEASRWEEDRHYVVAALFAWHPLDAPGEHENLGTSFARLLRERRDGSGVERRFVALLDAALEDLPHHLRQAVGLLRTEAVPVPWAQLLHDLRAWDWEGRPVQRAWARAFWAAVPEQTVNP